MWTLNTFYLGPGLGQGISSPRLQGNHQLSHNSGPNTDGSSLTQPPTPAPYSRPRTGPAHPPPPPTECRHSPAGPPATATQSTPGPTRRGRSPSDLAAGPKRAAQRQRTGAGGIPPGGNPFLPLRPPPQQLPLPLDAIVLPPNKRFLADLGGVTIVPDDLATDFNEMTEHDRNVVVLSTLRAVLSRLDSLTRSPAALNGPQAPAAADVPLAEQIRRFLFLPADK
ncbi:hypothetical protein PtA15_15A319 [Puccinia triticina]|uniref:Uncharacterized protein n=1 Tax=Puccinia triticina TaxID=208348 RepID=A0ABY7D2V5_9BASI|nr:uncharacterized protein PtA15_15A319 [Puccinia triticina]WAQ91926.1 hypothetical protein PtA15_15A319 [Puccinia triticina]